MRDINGLVRVVGIIILGLIVLTVVVPVVLTAAGIVVGTIAQLAVLLIKLAVFLAIGYLILVAVRAALR